jgi:hypothetical protein
MARKVVLVLALIAAPGAALSQTITLSGPHVVCRNLEQAVAVTDGPSVQAGTGLAMSMIQSGECIMLPKGEAVRVRYKEGRFSCVSPVSGGQCGWTLLGRRQR